MGDSDEDFGPAAFSDAPSDLLGYCGFWKSESGAAFASQNREIWLLDVATVFLCMNQLKFTTRDMARQNGRSM